MAVRWSALAAWLGWAGRAQADEPTTPAQPEPPPASATEAPPAAFTEPPAVVLPASKKLRSWMTAVRRAVNERWQANVDAIPSSVRLSAPRYVTAVDVVASADGRLVSVTVTRSSGVPELDDAVVRAFYAAAPFRSPPASLLGADGQMKLPNMEFTLDVGYATATPGAAAPEAPRPTPP